MLNLETKRQFLVTAENIVIKKEKPVFKTKPSQIIIINSKGNIFSKVG